MPIRRNSVPTKFTIDLTNLDIKIDKLVKYFKNCNIDLKDDGLAFINYNSTYETVLDTFDKKAFKISLSELINKKYTERFQRVKDKLISEGLINNGAGILIPGPIDDFGSRFDSNAAINSDPNNSVLKLLKIEPYRTLTVRILREEEAKLYNDYISSKIDADRILSNLQKLYSITQQHAESNSIYGQVNFSSYLTEVEKQVLSKIKELPSESTELIQINELKTDSEKLKQEYFSSYLQKVDSAFYDKINLPENSDKPLNQLIDSLQLEKNKINVAYEILNETLTTLVEDAKAVASNLDSLKCYYDFYDFIEQKFHNPYYDKDVYTPELNEETGKIDQNKTIPRELKVAANKIYFILTFSKIDTTVEYDKYQNPVRNSVVEFNIKNSFTVPGTLDVPTRQLNSQFTAVLSGGEIYESSPQDFFDPTILGILSDIEYINNNIDEVDPFYCPPPDGQNIYSKSKRAEDEALKTSLWDSLTKGKELVRSKPEAFTFKTFPEKYFMPYMYEIVDNKITTNPGFFDTISNPKLSPDKRNEIIRENSKFYYDSSDETPSSIIASDETMSKLFVDAAANNGFYGFQDYPKNSFFGTEQINALIKKITSINENGISQIEKSIFNKTNIGCLLKEFQTCFLPKVGNCRDILRGFRFKDLENILKRQFPESIYPTLYSSIKQFKKEQASEKERQLIEEIEALEQDILNNPRGRLISNYLDNSGTPINITNTADQLEKDSAKVEAEREKVLLEKQQRLEELQREQERLAQSTSEIIPAQENMDAFLDMLEDNGIDIESLCDLATLLADLSKLSFSFGSFPLPDFPSINLFSEISLKIDLAILEILYQTVVAFIVGILEELLTCNGIKDLVAAGITGDTSGKGLTPALAAFVNQLSTGRFNLDEFIKENPQIDPATYEMALKNIAKTAVSSVGVTQQAGVTVQTEIPFIPDFQLTERSSTSPINKAAQNYIDSFSSGQNEIENIFSSKSSQPFDVVSPTRTSGLTDQQIKDYLVELVNELSAVLDPLQFANLLAGKSLQSDLERICDYIKQNKKELSFLAVPQIIKNIFSYMANIVGLNDIINQVLAAASNYQGKKKLLKTDPLCDISNNPESAIQKELQENLTKDPTLEDKLKQIEKDRAKYRDLINSLLNSSPDKLKGLVDEQVIKPILLGMLPGGETIENVKNSEIFQINSSFDNLNKKFKSSVNDYYNKLALKKSVEVEVKKTLDNSSENPLYKELEQMGLKPIGDIITATREKYVYGGLFSENFPAACSSLKIDISDTKTDIRLDGKIGYTSDSLQKAFSSATNVVDNWTIENKQTSAENLLIIKRKDSNKTISTRKIVLNSNVSQQLNTNYQDLKEFQQYITNLIKSSSLPISTLEQQTLDEYSSKLYSRALSNTFTTISRKVSNDMLLRPLRANDKEMVYVKDSLGITDLFASSPDQKEFVDSDLFVNTPLKYINFAPKPTTVQRNKKVDPSIYGIKELENFVSNFNSLRKQILLDSSIGQSAEEMLKKGTITLTHAIVDGLYKSYIRTVCSEIALKNLFVYRTFKFSPETVSDLTVSNYVSQEIIRQFEGFSNLIKSDAFIEKLYEHIDFVHNNEYKNLISDSNYSYLFEEIQKLKIRNKKIEGDRRILIKYKKRLQGNIEESLKEKIEKEMKCIKEEYKENEKAIATLQTRNMCQLELETILDKLSYITCVNDKITGVSGSLPVNEQTIIFDALNNDLLSNPIMTYGLGNDTEKQDELQNIDSKLNNNVILEHYVYVPDIKDEYPLPRASQIKDMIYGIVPISKFKTFIENTTFEQDENNKPLSSYFKSDIMYGIRLIVSDPQSFELSKKQINKEQGDERKQAISRYVLDPLNYKYYIKENENSQINILNIYKDKSHASVIIKDDYIGILNTYPIVKNEVIFANESNKNLFIKDIEMIDTKNNKNLIDEVRNGLLCKDEFKKFYQIFISKNLLINLMTFTSLNILNNPDIDNMFTGVRYDTLNAINSNFMQLYKKMDANDFIIMLENLRTKQMHNTVNADLIIKTILRASIYVLQYYCQLTDPNISLAVAIRTAIKVALTAAGQQGIANAIPLSLISFGLMPLNIYPPPAAGPGIGPPLTIPGMILLGADVLLLSLEFASGDLENAENNPVIQQQLEEYSINLQGYTYYKAE